MRKKNTRTIVLLVVCALLIACVIGGILWLCLGGRNTPEEDPQSTASQATDPTDTPAANQPQAPTEETVESGIRLEHGLSVTHMGGYTGVYVEDGSNEIVSGVLMLRVTNNGERDIQYAELSMMAGENVAQFKLTTLPVGKTVVLLEQNGLHWEDGATYEKPVVSNVAFFQYPLSLQDNVLQLQVLEGGLNVTNISGQDITGDVVIYYKNATQGIYYGGITYRVRLQGGIKAGEIKQIMADHFSATGSEIVFITID